MASPNEGHAMDLSCLFDGGDLEFLQPSMGVGNDGIFHSQHFIVFSDCIGFSCIQRHGLASLQLDGGGVNGGLPVALCLHDADKILGAYK